MSINFLIFHYFSANAAAAAIEQAQWSLMPNSSQSQPSSSAAANAVAQAQAASFMGTVTADSYTAQPKTYEAVNSVSYEQQVRILHMFLFIQKKKKKNF